MRRRKRSRCSLLGCLKECFRLFCKPFRRASPLTAVIILVIYCGFISSGTWVLTELEKADAQDVQFARDGARSFTCSVIEKNRDYLLQSKISPGSRYLGDGVDLHILPSQRQNLCSELCTAGDHGTLIPYYCFHADVEIKSKSTSSVEVKLQSLDINCTNTCLRTGVITHRILTRRPTFFLPWYSRMPTLMATVQADARRAERLEQLRSSPSPGVDISGNDIGNDITGATEAAETQGVHEVIQNEDDVYGMARKEAGDTALCWLNPLPYQHPACINIRNSRSNVNFTNNTSINDTNTNNNATTSTSARRLNMNTNMETYKQQVQQQIPSSNSLFSYCPAAEDPCKWPSLAWEIPRGPRPLGQILIIIMASQWTIFMFLLWYWFARIVGAMVRQIAKFVTVMKQRTEEYKHNSSIQKGRCSKQQQLCFLRITSCGENWIQCCLRMHRVILLCGAKLGLVDPKNIPSMIGANEEESDDDSEFDTAEGARQLQEDNKQRMWDQLVHAVSKAIQRKKEKLNLRRMCIEKLPEVLNKGQDLFVSLNLAENILKDLNSSSLLSLKNLNKLFLMDNALTSLPNLTSLSSLTILDVDGNNLGRGTLEGCVLPQSLQKVYMNRNALRVFPECLLALTQCQWLYLAHNSLTDLSGVIPTPTSGETIGLSCSLTRLCLSHNQITLLPEQIGNLGNLEELWVSQNKLTRLPDSLCSLSILKILSIDSNRLTKLPEHLHELQQLVELNAESNWLVDVPNIVDIKTTKTLIFRNNKITDLPHWVGNLETIEHLDYSKNEIPKNVALEIKARLKKSSPYLVEAHFF